MTLKEFVNALADGYLWVVAKKAEGWTLEDFARAVQLQMATPEPSPNHAAPAPAATPTPVDSVVPARTHTVDIFMCDTHEQAVIMLDGVNILQNDYGHENILLLADHLGWPRTTTTLTSPEYERRFG